MDLQRKVRHFLHDDTTEIVVAVLIVISVLLIFVEIAIGVDHRHYDLLVMVNDAITILFIVELVLRFYAEKRKLRFFRKCWYDILAVIPFLRAFRFLRVLRLLRLYRVGFILARRLRRASAVFRVVRVEYIIIGLTIVTVILMGGLSMLAVEGRINGDFEGLEQALWFATMTLIGAEPIGGDPQTTAGRAITVGMMLSGMTFFAVLIGTVSAIMIDTLQKVRLHAMEFDELRDHVVICGWNQAGALIVRELIHDGGFQHFVVVAQDAALEDDPVVQANPGQVMVHDADYTSMEALRQAGVERAAVALLLADASVEERPPQDRDARTVLTAMLVEKLNPEIYTTVQLLNRDNEASLREIGVEEIIVSEEYVGNIMATVTRNHGIVSMLEELLTTTFGHQFYRCALPEEMVGMNIGEAVSHLKLEYNATLLAIDLEPDEAGKRVEVNPAADVVLRPEQFIYVAASEPIGPC